MLRDVVPDPVTVGRGHLAEHETDAAGEGLGRLSSRVPPGDPAAGHDRDLVPRNGESNLDVVARGKRGLELGKDPEQPQVDEEDLPFRSPMDQARSLDERDTDFAEDRLGGNAGPGTGWRGSWHGWARDDAR